MRIASLLLLLALPALAACGEAVQDDHFANDVRSERSEPVTAQPAAVPVRIGELGPNFNACNAAGTSRHLDPAAGDRLQVRAAPFDTAAETGAVAAGARFFICSRSHDQRWLGVVYDEAGALSAACGVSRPVFSRRGYEGPCRSGWVPSALVKQIAG
jgi:hypothetical protein